MSKVAEHLRRAKALEKAGKKHQAINAYLAMLGVFPGNRNALDALLRLYGAPKGERAFHENLFKAIASTRVGKMFLAKEITQGLIKKNPNHAELQALMASIHSKLHEHAAAIACCRQAHAIEPNSVSHRRNLGSALVAGGEVEEGLEILKSVADDNPKDPSALRAYVSASRLAGRLQQAEAALEVGLRRHPGDARHLLLATQVNVDKLIDQSKLRQMEALFRAKTLPQQEQGRLALALSAAYEARGEPEKTVKALKFGNTLLRREQPDEGGHEAALLANLKAHFTEPLTPLQDDGGFPQPIFVLGMPRSGTSLVEQILASHPDVSGAGELTWWNRAARPILREKKPTSAAPVEHEGLEDLRSQYRSLLSANSDGKRFVVDKMPSNTRWIGLIAAVFPSAPIVHMRRDPRATCWSVYRTTFNASGMGYSFDAKELVEFYKTYLEMMSFWEELLPGRIINVDYETLTENQVAETQRLLTACGLPWDDRVLEFHKTERTVATASVTQVRKKMYKGSSEAWRKFAPYLPELFDALPEKY